MNEPGMRFPSKVDKWLVALVAPALLVGPVSLIALGQTGSIGAILFTVAVSVVVAAPVVWIFTATAYFVTDTELIVRSGPLRIVVKLEAIQRIRSTATLLSSPALSLDRLEVQYAKRSAVVISPADKAGFVAAIQRRVPGVVVELKTAGRSSAT